MNTETQSTATASVTRRMYGRKQIFTNASEINRDNVLTELNKALQKFWPNREDIIYLENYVRGKQPVLDREKAVNGEINNKIVVNRANQIVTFKTANFAGEPIQYVSRSSKKAVPKKVEKLNSLMISEGKTSKDMELAYKMFTDGVAYRLVLKDKSEAYMNGDLFDEAPFEIYTPEPRNTFVVRLNDVSKRVVMGVTFVFEDDSYSNILYTVYTDNVTYRIRGSALSVGEIIEEIHHNFGMVTLIEYPCNSLRMGAFEVVLSLLDAINTTESNRLDGVEQFIQAIMVFQGVDITREQFLELKDLGAIKLPPDTTGTGQSKVYYLNEQLDQSQTQTLADALYQEVLEIVGIPSMGSGNTSDSSNNGAMIVKNGWWDAEARALETEGMWRAAETEFLKVVLKICSEANALTGISLSDVECKFGRRSYEDKLVKTQSFTTLISAGCPPIQAFSISGMVTDPEAAAIQYENYQGEQEKSLEEYAVSVAQEQKAQLDENV